MQRDKILIARSKLVENTISPYNNSSYDMDGLIKGIQAKGLQNPIHVRLIPGTDMFEIIDGIMRNRGYGILKRTHIESVIREISDEEIPALIIELNRAREKSFFDKLEEGYLILKTIPSESGSRNDLKGKTTGLTRTIIAGAKVGISASSLEKYVAIKAMHEKYPNRKIMSTLKSKEKSLTKIYEDELANDKLVTDMNKGVDEMVKKFPAFEEMINNPQPSEPVADEIPNYLLTDSFCIHKKPCEEMLETDIPRIWLLPKIQKVGFTSIPYWDQATYDPKNPHELGHEKSAEDYLEDIKPMMRRMFEILSPGESYFVNLNDTYSWDMDNIIPELFVTMMTKELGYHKVATIIWHKTNTTMKGRIEKRPYNSWEYIYWFVKDSKTFYADKSGRFYNNIKFYDKNRKIEFGSYGGRKNKDGSKTKEKIHFTKPYKRFTDFIDGQQFLDTIITSNSGTDNLRVKKLFGVAHPCPFLTTTPLYPILYCTKPKDIVIDPFMGSGSTLVTAALMGRKALGFEVVNKWFDLSKDRLLAECKTTDLKMAQLIEAQFNHKWINAA